jgi:hypothetical protein
MTTQTGEPEKRAEWRRKQDEELYRDVITLKEQAKGVKAHNGALTSELEHLLGKGGDVDKLWTAINKNKDNVMKPFYTAVIAVLGIAGTLIGLYASSQATVDQNIEANKTRSLANKAHDVTQDKDNVRLSRKDSENRKELIESIKDLSDSIPDAIDDHIAREHRRMD